VPWLACVAPSVRPCPVWLLATLLVLGSAAGRAAPSAALPEGASIAGVAVGGKTPEDARTAVAARAEELERSPVTLLLGDTARVATLASLGISFRIDDALDQASRDAGDSEPVDIPLAARADRAKLRQRLTAIGEAVRRAPKGATISITGIRAALVPEVVGVALDLDAAVAAVEKALAGGAANRVIEVPLVLTRPERTREALAGYRVLGHCATRFNASQANRTQNVRLAVSSVDDTWVPAGAVFSLNSNTGQRSPQSGYKKANVYAGGRVVLGYGGGVCQVSTTVYNAALMAGMPIVERHPHSMSVPYVPWGRDATVSWGTADMKFRNATESALLVRGWVEGDSLHICLVGRTKPPAKPPAPETAPAERDRAGPLSAATSPGPAEMAEDASGR